MRAAVYETFNHPLTIQNVADPTPADDGVVIEVQATGICRSDWHGWKGHDDMIALPHVPGHEMAGIVVAMGKSVRRYKKGDRVTLPFANGCGDCPQCLTGNHQVCSHQTQPGFSHWGSFAQYVAIRHADVNLVPLPEEIDDITAALLGCRFITAFRALVDQGRLRAGEWVAVHGCGGVGLSAIMIAKAIGANAIGIDIDDDKLKFASEIGTAATINSKKEGNVVEALRDLTRGGVHISVDALGHAETCFNSISGLRRRGRHIQVGLMMGDQANTQVPMDLVIARELEILGSHGMAAHRYSSLLQMIASGQLNPRKLIGKRVDLASAPRELAAMDTYDGIGITVIDRI
jgi:alcohol dehydrogenase